MKRADPEAPGSNRPPTRHWYETRAVQTRFADHGLDHGADGQVLAEIRRGNEVHRRLVWRKGYQAPVCGVRGFGQHYVPASLTIQDGKGYFVHDVFKGGRVTSVRLVAHRDDIDTKMGAHVTDLVDPRRTLVAVLDDQ